MAAQATTTKDGISNGIMKISSFDVWALGISVVIGGQYFSWNFGLAAGFGSYFIAAMIIGFGYLALSLALSEISSGLPFGGGTHRYLFRVLFFLLTILQPVGV